MIITYKILHRLHSIPGYDFLLKLQQAKDIAYTSLAYKKEKISQGHKSGYYITTKGLNERGIDYSAIGSTAACSVVKKYISNKLIKGIKRVVIPIPWKNGSTENFSYDGKYITINIKRWRKPDGNPVRFRWGPGRKINHLCQMEINSQYIYLSVEVPEKTTLHHANYLGVDVNASHHIVVASDLSSGNVYKIGKTPSNIRKKYSKKVAKLKAAGNTTALAELGSKVKRITRNADHQMSSDLVKLANRNKLNIVLERITGIRNKAVTGDAKDKRKNFVINSWSFYRLQSYICYKAKLSGVHVIYVDPAYTSQECSRCGCIKPRDLGNLKKFYCPNKKCKHKDHADANAGFNIAKRGQDDFIERSSTLIADAILRYIHQKS
jgi:putative transposase